MKLNFNATTNNSRRSASVEVLEPRLMLHGKPLPWDGNANLTLSFAPDGTNIAGVDSSLLATLDELAPTAQWQEAILRAFQTWAAETNAAIGVVSDTGAEFGIAGATHGDSRFGDIRIGAAPLEDGLFAFAIPAGDVLSGTWVGDVIFNSNAQFASLDQLFAVALHEAGHVFGMEHSDDPLSPMRRHGSNLVTSLTAADVLALESLYGSPQSDLNERTTSNDSLVSATQLKPNTIAGGGPGSAPSLVYGGITHVADVDYFRLARPEGYSGSITITVRSSGISLLAPRLTILDSQGVVLQHSASASAEGDVLVLTAREASTDGALFIQVASGRSDVLGVGSYSLFAVFDAANEVTTDVINEAASGALWFLPQHELAKVLRGQASAAGPYHFYYESHANDQSSTSTRLTATSGFLAQARYETVGSISDPHDVDFYRVTAPASGGSVMTIRVRSLEDTGLIPKITVLSHNGEALPLAVLVNGNGEYVVQLAGVEARDTVEFSVAAANAAGPFATGNYQLIAGFGDKAVELDPAVNGVLTQSEPVRETSLYVALPQLFHFGLAVSGSSAPANTAVVLTIRDADNNIVFRIAAQPGDTRTAGSVLLKPGAYRVQAAALSIGPLAVDLDYTLSAYVSSDPFAADPDDPTFQPEFQCGDEEHEGFYCYPGHFVSADAFLWENFLETLPDPPTDLPLEQIVEDLLFDWWTWVWQQMGVDGPPLARGDTFKPSTGQDSTSDLPAASSPFNVLENDFDPEQSEVFAILRSTTSHGQLTLHPDGTFEYVPTEGFEGVDSFTYVATDNVSESSEVTVRIHVGFRGDYDSSSFVDGADFLSWQQSLGQSVTPAGGGADGDGDGVVTLADGFVWNDNFGLATPTPPVMAEFTLSEDGVDWNSIVAAAPLTVAVETTSAKLLSNSAGAIGLEALARVDPSGLNQQVTGNRTALLLRESGPSNDSIPCPPAGWLSHHREPAAHWRRTVDRALDELFGQSLGRILT